MTPDMLISEGQSLARPCVFLRPGGNGPVAAVWHELDQDEFQQSGYRCWITVDTQYIPDLPETIGGHLRVFTNERKGHGGRIELDPLPSHRPGLELRAYEELVLPPIEAIFLRGSTAIEEWLVANRWSRRERYNDNFPDRRVVNVYEQEWFKGYPLYRDDGTYAVLGGWHFPGADDDWYELVDEQLLVLTIHDSEPWVEAWRLRNGLIKVIQRIT
jgi:hypothetical protein